MRLTKGPPFTEWQSMNLPKGSSDSDVTDVKYSQWCKYEPSGVGGSPMSF